MSSVIKMSSVITNLWHIVETCLLVIIICKVYTFHHA